MFFVALVGLGFCPVERTRIAGTRRLGAVRGLERVTCRLCALRLHQGCNGTAAKSCSVLRKLLMPALATRVPVDPARFSSICLLRLDRTFTNTRCLAAYVTVLRTPLCVLVRMRFHAAMTCDLVCHRLESVPRNDSSDSLDDQAASCLYNIYISHHPRPKVDIRGKHPTL